MAPQSAKPVEVFFSYSHKDEELRDQLANHLTMMKRNGTIRDWHDRRITAGQQWGEEIDKYLESADIILLLISPDFLASDYCYDVEVKRAMERHDAGEASVIPIILRHCDDWQSAPFGKLQALPTDARPVNDWPDRDKAFANVAAGIRRAVEELRSNREPKSELPEEMAHAPQHSAIPRDHKVGFVPRHNKNGGSIVERLRDELAPQKNQLIALWGAGGVGKTRLTAEAARGLEASGQRVIWVSADGRTNFTLSTLLDDIAAQFDRTDLRSLALEPKQEAVRALIADAPTLIILDNFETIPPEEQPSCVSFLAERANCPALITTREEIDDVRSLPLYSMLAEEGNSLLDKLVEQTRDPDIFDKSIRSRILETAEYNPLIIQWIVRQINLANAPEEVLRELAHGEGKAAERVFDRSFNLPQMAEGGRAVLLALSRFMPSATRAALAEVAGMGKEKDKKKFKKAQETLASLWLLSPASGGQRVAVEGLTREFAKARLLNDPRSKPFRQRFVARFLRYAKANSERTAAHLNSMEAEKDNILSAMDVAVELGDLRSAMRLYDAAYSFLNFRGYWDEAIRRGEQALTIARNLANERAISIFTHYVAILHQQQGVTEKARRLYGESLDIKKRLGDQEGIAATLHQLAVLARHRGEVDEARQLFDESIDIEKRLGNQSGVAITLHSLATLALDRREVDEARRLYGESLDIRKEIGDQSGVAAILHQLGTICIDEGDLLGAEKLFDESLAILKKLGHKQYIAECLESIGKLKVIQGSVSEARSLFDEALQMARALPDRFRIASVKHSSGLLADKAGDRAKAMLLLREALDIFEELKSPEEDVARRDLERIEGEDS